MLKDRLVPKFFQCNLESAQSPRRQRQSEANTASLQSKYTLLVPLSLAAGGRCPPDLPIFLVYIYRCRWHCGNWRPGECAHTERVTDRLPTVPRQAASTAHNTFSGSLAAVLQLLPHMRLNLCLELPSRLTQRWGQSTAACFSGSPHQQHFMRTSLKHWPG